MVIGQQFSVNPIHRFVFYVASPLKAYFGKKWTVYEYNLITWTEYSISEEIFYRSLESLETAIPSRLICKKNEAGGDRAFFLF